MGRSFADALACSALERLWKASEEPPRGASSSAPSSHALGPAADGGRGGRGRPARRPGTAKSRRTRACARRSRSPRRSGTSPAGAPAASRSTGREHLGRRRRHARSSAPHEGRRRVPARAARRSGGSGPVSAVPWLLHRAAFAPCPGGSVAAASAGCVPRPLWMDTTRVVGLWRGRGRRRPARSRALGIGGLDE
jgi:hypothetical protein